MGGIQHEQSFFFQTTLAKSEDDISDDIVCPPHRVEISVD
jgi:hypothetical protein